VEKSVVIPNGMVVSDFDDVYAQRMEMLKEIEESEQDRVWKLVYIARVVPIKGLLDLIETVRVLVDRGTTNFHLDILGPTEHTPDYYELCLEKARDLEVEQYLTFHGTVDVRQRLGEFDILVLSSYNEGQPIVVLEAMTAGIPTVGTNVGGMEQLIGDPLKTPSGETLDSCGVLVQPGQPAEMADGLQRVMGDTSLYRRFAHNARARVTNFFQLDEAMAAYNQLYRELGAPALPVLQAETMSAGVASAEEAGWTQVPAASSVRG
jgi:polysaccharide biosynthesis protein PelF